MGIITILEETTKKPLTLMGRRAGVCWGADITDDGKNYKRGLDCLQSGHGRVMEYVNVEMVIDGYSARVIREWYTHLGGSPTRLQASTRYINYSVPHPLSLPKGCKFGPRCKFCTKKCMEEEPELVKVAEGHEVRCFYPELAKRTAEIKNGKKEEKRHG